MTIDDSINIDFRDQDDVFRSLRSPRHRRRGQSRPDDVKRGVRVCNFEKIDFFCLILWLNISKIYSQSFKSIREKFLKLLTS